MSRANRTGSSFSALVQERLFAAFAALAIVVVAYPGVCFMGGSLAPSNLGVVVDRSQNPITQVNLPFGVVLTPIQSFGIRDLGAPLWQLEPATRFVAHAIEEGENPFWNPYSGSGTPALSTLADIKSSPFVLLTGALGASVTAFSFVVLGFVALGAFFTIDFLRNDLRLGRFVAFVGGAVFVLNGFAVSYLVSQVAAPYFLFPAVLVALYRYLTRPSAWRLALTGLAHAALFITTFVPVVVSVLAAVHILAWYSVSDTTERTGSWIRRVGAHSTVMLLGVGLAGVVLAPVASHLLTGSDVSIYQARDLGNKSPWLALGLGSRFHLWTAFDRSDPAEIALPAWTMYLGLVPLLTLAAGLGRQDRLRRLYTASWVVLVAGVLLHTDIPWLGAVGDLPFIRTVRPDYWAALMAVGLVVLVPLSLQRIGERGVNQASLLVAGVVVTIAYATGYFYLRDELAVGAGWRVLWVLVALFAVVSAMVLSARFPRKRVIWVVGGLIMVELLSYVNHVWPQRIEMTSSLPSYVSFLASEDGEGRVLDAGRTALYPDWGSALGIEQLGTMNIGQDAVYSEWFASYVNPRESLFLQVGRDWNADPNEDLDDAALDQLSVRYLVVEERMEPYVSAIRATYPEVLFDVPAKVHVFANEDAFPRAYVTSTVRLTVDPLAYATSTDVALTTDKGFYQRAVGAGVAPEDMTPASHRVKKATVVERTATRLVVDVDASDPGVLIVTDKWDEDWTASVNGETERLDRVNGPLRGVVVPSGRSRVVMTYEDDTIAVGGVISLLTLAGLIAALSYEQLTRRRETETRVAVRSQGRHSG